MTSSFRHITVLLDEAVEALAVRADGCYMDGTFGRGGHSRLILERLGPDGRLLGFDKDPLAIATGNALAAEDGRFVIVQRSFAELGAEVAERGLHGKVSGVSQFTNGKKVYNEATNIRAAGTQNVKFKGKPLSVNMYRATRGGDVMEYGLAPSLGNIPALIRYTDDGKTYQLNLTAATLDGKKY